METDRQLDSCGNDHLSKRGTWTKDIPNFMGTYSAKVFADPYHPKNNPQVCTFFNLVFILNKTLAHASFRFLSSVTSKYAVMNIFVDQTFKDRQK